MFHWGYMSFYKYDSTWVYREVLILPVVVLFLWFCWMKVVRNELKEEIVSYTLRDGTTSNPDSEYEVIDSDGEGVAKKDNYSKEEEESEMSETTTDGIKDKDL
uniref:Uncharacterized protein n=1 Tax=Lepeophtheirus salmonis TaxID=72036 RepID=A0A0K2SZV3_LEPSM